MVTFFNVGGFKADEMEDLLFEKEKFMIRTLITQYHGLNSKYDLKENNDVNVKS